MSALLKAKVNLLYLLLRMAQRSALEDMQLRALSIDPDIRSAYNLYLREKKVSDVDANVVHDR